MTLGKRIKKIFLILFLLVTLAIMGIAVWFYVTYGKDILALKEKAKGIARKSTEESFKASQTSLVYAEDGSLLSVLKTEKETYYLPYDSIPDNIIQAVLVTEDKKFFTHEGVDYLANLRAVLALIKNKGEIKQGGSTITQQLARNIFLSNEVTYERKVTELFLAVELEKKYTKKQILEYYLNNIYYANGYYGIQAASNGYFSRGVSDLSLSEIAFLSAIPNSPTRMNPLTNFSETIERRDKILLQMYEDKKISFEQYKDAISEEIELKHNQATNHNYAESYTYYCTIRSLMEAEGFAFRVSFTNEEDKNQYEESYYDLYYQIQRQLYTKGYRIYTSLDLNKQEELQKSVDESLSSFTDVNKEGIYELQGAAVCIDNDTGYVVAIVGGRSQETIGYTLNRAYQSFRQPGSAIKPLLIYTPIFERGYYPDSMVLDEKTKDGPKNATEVYSGEITIQRAVESSKNTVAWNLLKELSPSVGLSYLLEMNFSHIVGDDYNLGISLGGFTYGVSTVEMTSGYACIENDGVYRSPTCIVKITDSEGNEVVGNTNKEKRIYETNASQIMTDVLTGVMKNGTGRSLALKHITAAGKTGTTTDQKDGWFIGYSKYYTTGVWVGCDYPKKINDLSGNTYPGYIWRDFMDKIHEEFTDISFETFEDNRQVETNEGTTNEEITNNEAKDKGVVNEEVTDGEVVIRDANEDNLNAETLNEEILDEISNEETANDELVQETEDEMWDEEQWILEQWPSGE